MTLLTTESGQNPVATGGRPRVLSGMRPTGRLHLGNYMGALYNWVKLQHEYECYFFIADYHALTTDYADTSRLQENIKEVALDFLAAGLDPKLSTIFVQSDVKEHFELNALLSMITPLSWLERVPSYKDQQEQLKEKDLATFGFLGYPLLQSADILLYQPRYVPVGQDQAAHVEITREIARRFNSLYSGRRNVGSLQGTVFSPSKPDILPEPEVLLTPSPKLPGLDGRKMSKSYGNTILLSDEPPVVRSKMLQMSNGGQRFSQDLPGDPYICPVGDIHRVFSTAETATFIEGRCRTAGIGCATCKQIAGDSVSKIVEPIYIERLKLEDAWPFVEETLTEGGRAASSRAQRTMTEVRRAMGVDRSVRTPYADSTRRRNFAAAMGLPSAHDLTALEKFWEAEPSEQTRELISYWLGHMLPRDIVLRHDAGNVFITQSNKRVYLASSSELTEGVWDFVAKPKSYDVMVLLCWKRNLGLYDFVVPRKIYVETWTRLKKEFKVNDIRFAVGLDEAGYSLTIGDSPAESITTYQGLYDQLR